MASTDQLTQPTNPLPPPGGGGGSSQPGGSSSIPTTLAGMTQSVFGSQPLENQTVQGNVANITAAGGPLMQRAASQGARMANRRGLLNSTMAAEASQNAVLDKAIAIATPDAQLANNRDMARMDAAGQWERLNRGGEIDLQKIAAETQGQKELLTQKGEQDIALLDKETTAAMDRLRYDTEQQMTRLREQLANADAQQARDIQAQMERLQASNAAEMDRLREQGRIQSGLQSQQDTAAMDRLNVSNSAELARVSMQLASSERVADRQIAAQMNQLVFEANASMDRLQAQLTNADAQQQREITAQMDRLRESTNAEMQRLAAAAGYDMQRLERQGQIDIARDAAQATTQQDLARLQSSLASQLQAQGNTEQIGRMNIELANNLARDSQTQQDALARIAASGDQELRRLAEAANQERVTLAQSIQAQDRERQAQSMIAIFNAEAQMRSALLANNNIPASERAAYEAAITSLGNPLRAYVGQLYGGTTPTNTGGTSGGLLPSSPAPVTTGGGGLLPTNYQ